MPTDAEHWVIDRFEAGIAVLVSDDGGVVEVARSLLPHRSKAGAVLRITRDADGDIVWGEVCLDEEATAERIAEAESILAELRGRDPGGDIAL